MPELQNPTAEKTASREEYLRRFHRGRFRAAGEESRERERDAKTDARKLAIKPAVLSRGRNPNNRIRGGEDRETVGALHPLARVVGVGDASAAAGGNIDPTHPLA
jgi:hypothetical protein